MISSSLFAMTFGYVLGTVPFGLLLTRAAGLGDIRRIGSGNIGATNVLRTGRTGLALGTLLLDGGKGAVVVLLAYQVCGAIPALAAGFGAVLGHLFPVWLSFRGGKGVATGLGVLLAAAWPVGIVSCVVWLLVAVALRISSAAALAAYASAPIAAALLAQRGVMALAMALTGLVFIRHRANIRRLVAGTEPRIGLRR